MMTKKSIFISIISFLLICLMLWGFSKPYEFYTRDLKGTFQCKTGSMLITHSYKDGQLTEYHMGDVIRTTDYSYNPDTQVISIGNDTYQLENFKHYVYKVNDESFDMIKVSKTPIYFHYQD